MEIETEFEDQVTFIGVPGLGEEVAHRDFLDSTGANTFSTLIEADEVWGDFGVSSQGTFVFLDDDGTFTTDRRTGSLRENVERLISS